MNNRENWIKRNWLVPPTIFQMDMDIFVVVMSRPLPKFYQNTHKEINFLLERKFNILKVYSLF